MGREFGEMVDVYGKTGQFLRSTRRASAEKMVLTGRAIVFFHRDASGRVIDASPKVRLLDLERRCQWSRTTITALESLVNAGEFGYGEFYRTVAAKVEGWRSEGCRKSPLAGRYIAPPATPDSEPAVIAAGAGWAVRKDEKPVYAEEGKLPRGINHGAAGFHHGPGPSKSSIKRSQKARRKAKNENRVGGNHPEQKPTKRWGRYGLDEFGLRIPIEDGAIG